MAARGGVRGTNPQRLYLSLAEQELSGDFGGREHFNSYVDLVHSQLQPLWHDQSFAVIFYVMSARKHVTKNDISSLSESKHQFRENEEERRDPLNLLNAMH